MSCLTINIWNMALCTNCPLSHLHPNNKVLSPPAVVYPPLFQPTSSSSYSSSPSLLPSPALRNDLCGNNYWVISALITLNICSVTMLRAFGCALGQLLCVLTVLRCRQTVPPSSTAPLSLHMCSLHYRDGSHMSGRGAIG